MGKEPYQPPPEIDPRTPAPPAPAAAPQVLPSGAVLLPAQAKRRAAARERERRSELAAAREAWGRLSHARQLQIAEEIVKTRGRELARAYPDVVALAHGYRSKRKGGKPRRVREPAVTCMVAKKWAKGAGPADPDRAIPKFLLAFATWRNRRVLCAVPTDVESATDFADVRPQAGAMKYVAAFTDGNEVDAGAVTCVVRRGDEPTQLYLLGCLHVFGLNRFFYDKSRPSIRVSPCVITGGRPDQFSRAAPLASFTRHCGILVDGFSDSFDASLARVVDPSQLDALARGSGPFAVANEPDDIRLETEYKIRSPRGPLRATYFKTWLGLEKAIDYEVDGRAQPVRISHTELIQSTAATLPGDSGSAVLSTSGRKFLGMHVAGDGAGKAFMIPAYRLLRTDGYVGLPRGQKLQVERVYTPWP